ncbi:MAG: saccharopine dehydrogenase C-terminal domain-containing protein [Planctomycetota bacterium]|nr:saccharopine dehydrogenase C-terminal domain-containing protein [Planctomycetota bacterium]
MAKFLVLGCGMIGSLIARELATCAEAGEGGPVGAGHLVTVADARSENLRRMLDRVPAAADRVRCVEGDLSSPGLVTRLALDADVVVGAMPSRLGLQTLRAVIDARRTYCDISFMPEDPSELSEMARSAGVTVIVDCGVAPGMSNLLAAHAAAQLDTLHSVSIFVGGLPRERRLPFEYKAAFSPYDVLEEYTRVARVVEHGRIVQKEALSEPEYLEFPGVGTLEAFNTDGLRSLMQSLKAPFMKEKTLRYPGHAQLMRAFRDIGLFSEEEVRLGERRIRPRELTAALLFPKWTYEPGEEDLTVMRVSVEGTKFNQVHTLSWDLTDFYDHATQSTSMARTTGYTCTTVARLLASGRFSLPGVHAPEALASIPGLVEDVLTQLEQRGVRYALREVWN